MGIPSSRMAEKDHTSEASGNGRLDSWKGIADYLDRTVRTVQRWEKREGLPVHRHLHQNQASVYAYRSELDAWLKVRTPGAQPVRRVHEFLCFIQRFPGAIVSLAALLTLVGLIWWMGRPDSALDASRHFSGQYQWALIVDFENHTTESALDGVLEGALERGLGYSGRIRIAPPEHIAEVLRLMQRPRDAPIDVTLGREICLRGGISALLTGRLETSDSSYVLTVQLLDPGQGLVVASKTETAATREELWPAVDTITEWARKNLERQIPEIRRREEELERVTTDSLRALRLYSKAMTFINSAEPFGLENWLVATELLNQALMEDPRFASAHVYLAHCYSNVGHGKQAASHYQRAFELADAVTEQERFFIRGSYYQRYLEDPDKAIQAYRALLALHPDHYWGVQNLGGLLEEKGRELDALTYRVRRAELRPFDFQSNYDAWRALVVLEKDPAKASLFLQRAQRLAQSEESQQQDPEAWIQLQFAETYKLIRNRSLIEALGEIEHLAERLDSVVGPARELLLAELGGCYLNLGRLHMAEQCFEKLPSGSRHYQLAQLAEIRGDLKTLRFHLVQQVAAGGPMLRFGPGAVTAARLALAGFHSEAERLISVLRDKDYPSWDVGVQFAEGVSALEKGQLDQALPLLSAASESLRATGHPFLRHVLGPLSRALELNGDPEGAAQVLDDGLQAVGPGFLSWESRYKIQLFELFVKLGKKKDAKQIVEDLEKLLVVADRDHPFLAILSEFRTAC